MEAVEEFLTCLRAPVMADRALATVLFTDIVGLHKLREQFVAGLPALREMIARLPLNTGILLNGRIGVTSHLADVLRKARIPARMKH